MNYIFKVKDFFLFVCLQRSFYSEETKFKILSLWALVYY